MMTKKDFIALADAIRNNSARCLAHTGRYGTPFSKDQLDTLAAFCRSCNPRFDRERWLAYIRGECGPNGGAIRKSKGGA